MLAEPRRKNKYSADPRGQTWSNDNDKFGQKLMEKMGWTKGKGLGAKLDGNTSHVKVSNKFDSRGVGCSKSYADNWVSHQDDFNALLANLNQDSDVQSDATQVQNLEEKGKMSKGRLNYQKFTRGKDLSGASNLDMDCIFGRRKNKSASNTPLDQSEASSDEESAVSEPEAKSHGVITRTSTLSVQDYFAQKLASLKQANKVPSENGNENSCNSKKRKIDREHGEEGIGDELMEPSRKKTKKKKTKKSKTRHKELEKSYVVPRTESFSTEFVVETENGQSPRKGGGVVDCAKQYKILEKQKKRKKTKKQKSKKNKP